MPAFCSGVDEGAGRGDDGRAHADAHRAAPTMSLAVDGDLVAGGEVLDLAEIGQDVGVGPAAGPTARPGVEVAGMAAHIDHVVDARRPAEHLTARRRHTAAVQSQARLAGIAGEHPVGGGIELQAGAGHRHQLGLRRPLTRLQQDDPAGRVFAQARGDHRPGGAPAHDDEIVGFRHRPLPVKVRASALVLCPGPGCHTPRAAGFVQDKSSNRAGLDQPVFPLILREHSYPPPPSHGGGGPKGRRGRLGPHPGRVPRLDPPQKGREEMCSLRGPVARLNAGGSACRRRSRCRPCAGSGLFRRPPRCRRRRWRRSRA